RAAGGWRVRSVNATRELGDLASLTITIPAMAVAWLEVGDPERAAVLWGASEAASEKYGVEAPAGLAFLVERWNPIERIRAELGQDRFDEAIARGRRMSLDEASDFIIEIAAHDIP